MQFVDKLQLKVKAGNGGNGLTSFRRERFIAKGGPDGGDGGDGGDIIARADHNLNTLAEFRYQGQIKADSGGDGQNQRKHGKNGADIVMRVPVGTVIYANNEVLADLTQDGQQVTVARGGKGGFGNAHFKSSTRQAPRVAEKGEPGEAQSITLELKLLAEVGVVGLPNAGKSTFLSIVSNAKPEVADYPFTTLVPNLGVVDIGERSILFADIPGLIEGASQGKGLGDEFLRHVERTRLLLHLVDITSSDILRDYEVIRGELASYKIDLSAKPQVVALTKVDAVTDTVAQKQLQVLKKSTKGEVFLVSAVKRKGVDELLGAVAAAVDREAKRAKKADKTKKQPPIPTVTLADDPSAWWIEEDKGKLVIKGEQLERFAQRTDFRSEAGLDRLRDILRRRGVARELENKHQVKAGDKLEIAGKNLEW